MGSNPTPIRHGTDSFLVGRHGRISGDHRGGDCGGGVDVCRIWSRRHRHRRPCSGRRVRRDRRRPTGADTGCPGLSRRGDCYRHRRAPGGDTGRRHRPDDRRERQPHAGCLRLRSGRCQFAARGSRRCLSFRLRQTRRSRNAGRRAWTTPAATIGVRGTDFWGGPIDRQTGFVLLGGAIDVTVGDATVVGRQRRHRRHLWGGGDAAGHGLRVARRKRSRAPSRRSRSARAGASRP